MSRNTALIIGAGPAGLTAALEFQKHSAIRPVVLEASQEIGGIARTVRYKGNRMDIGGHRFFSKSDRVMQWWLEQMPVEDSATGASAAAGDRVMLVRRRKSRIYALRTFFDYPLALTAGTLRRLGARRAMRVGLSYLRVCVFPLRRELSLQDFLINRFGRELYRLFFQSYTEKVWGVACDRISADWGAQRIRGLSLWTAVQDFVRRAGEGRPVPNTVGTHSSTHTSLIESFLYPKFGPGQLWETVAEKVTANGGELRRGQTVVSMHARGRQIVSVQAQDEAGNLATYPAAYFISTMPMRELIRAMVRGSVPVPEEVQQIAEGLVYRDFITVGLLVDRLAITEGDGSPLRDTWIYIQEPGVLLGRLQIFNNWSPHLVQHPDKIWLGLEYFCYRTDALWSRSDDELKALGAEELCRIGLLQKAYFEDGHVVRVPQSYPAYFGSYDRFHELRAFTDSFQNLFLIGRNGMHKYNNQDHSMLTAMQAVENILDGVTDKSNLWNINAERTHHEDSVPADTTVSAGASPAPAGRSGKTSHTPAPSCS